MKAISESPRTSTLVPGALIIHGVIPEHTTITMNQEISEAVGKIASEVGLTANTIEKLCSAWSDKANFVRKAANSVETDLLAALNSVPELADESYKLQETSLFVGSYTRGDNTHAHQDIAYRWDRPLHRYAITTWLALDYCDVTSGALLFSHTTSRSIQIRQDFLSSDFIDKATTPAWITSQVVATVQPGDVVVFDSCVWHASAKFSTYGKRCALAVRWTTVGGQQHEPVIPKPIFEENRFGIDTAGSLLKSAIILAYPTSPGFLSDTSPQDCVDWLISRNAGFTQSLSTDAQVSLRQLSCALQLAQSHAARPASQVWKSIRDLAIPELHALSHTR